MRSRWQIRETALFAAAMLAWGIRDASSDQNLQHVQVQTQVLNVDQLHRLPIGRSYEDILTTTPGVVMESGATEPAAPVTGSGFRRSTGFVQPVYGSLDPAESAKVLEAIRSKAIDPVLLPPTIRGVSGRTQNINLLQGLDLDPSDYKGFNVGLNLTVEPQLMGDMLSLKLQPTVSMGDEWSIKPGITYRTHNLNVRNGETVLIGGLYDQPLNIKRSKLPVFGRIPVLGSLFRSEESLLDTRNLVIILTPSLLDDEGGAGGGGEGSVSFDPQLTLPARSYLPHRTGQFITYARLDAGSLDLDFDAGRDHTQGQTYDLNEFDATWTYSGIQLGGRWGLPGLTYGNDFNLTPYLDLYGGLKFGTLEAQAEDLDLDPAFDWGVRAGVSWNIHPLKTSFVTDVGYTGLLGGKYSGQVGSTSYDGDFTSTQWDIRGLAATRVGSWWDCCGYAQRTTVYAGGALVGRTSELETQFSQPAFPDRGVTQTVEFNNTGIELQGGIGYHFNRNNLLNLKFAGNGDGQRVYLEYDLSLGRDPH